MNTVQYRYTVGCSSFNCIKIITLMNKYGHPHKELLDRLEKADSQVEITYETGAVMIETDGENLEMERHLK